MKTMKDITKQLMLKSYALFSFLKSKKMIVCHYDKN